MSELEDEYMRLQIKKIVHKNDEAIVQESTEQCKVISEQFN